MYYVKMKLDLQQTELHEFDVFMNFKATELQSWQVLENGNISS